MKKNSISDLAIFGGSAACSEQLHVGQLNFPDRERVQRAFQGIFDRQYYTNHGPLVREFEKRICEYLGVSHAVCVVNGTVALMVAAKALGMQGKVIVPAFTFIATVQALSWAGLSPVFCDADPKTHCITPESVESLIDKDVSGILPVHVWGRACDVEGFARLSRQYDLSVFYDAAHAMSCSFGEKMIGNFGQAEVFSLHATKVLQAAEGGVITTNDDELAGKLKTVRNFHVSETHCPVDLRINAKMSEAQAAMGMLSLEDISANIENNARKYHGYMSGLAHLSGVDMVRYDENEKNNYQYVVLSISPEQANLTRDQLLVLLKAENVLARKYFAPGIHTVAPYDKIPSARNLPNTDLLCSQLMQLPSGFFVRDEDVETIVELMEFLILNGGDIASRLARQGM